MKAAVRTQAPSLTSALLLLVSNAAVQALASCLPHCQTRLPAIVLLTAAPGVQPQLNHHTTLLVALSLSIASGV